MFDSLKTLDIKDEADYKEPLEKCANCRYRIFTSYPPAACRKLSDKIGTNVYISDDGICKHYERKSND